MKTMKSGIWIAFVFVLAGCVPNATVYYKPSVDVESTHELGHCVPTERFVLFTIQTSDQILKVRGHGNVYSNDVAEVVEAQYVIEGNWQDIKYQNAEFFLLASGSEVKIKPLKTYGEVHDFRGQRSFNSGAVFKRPAGESFEFIFPPLLIDGEKVELPVLHLNKKIWVGISPFNC